MRINLRPSFCRLLDEISAMLVHALERDTEAETQKTRPGEPGRAC